MKTAADREEEYDAKQQATKEAFPNTKTSVPSGVSAGAAVRSRRVTAGGARVSTHAPTGEPPPPLCRSRGHGRRLRARVPCHVDRAAGRAPEEPRSLLPCLSVSSHLPSQSGIERLEIRACVRVLTADDLSSFSEGRPMEARSPLNAGLEPCVSLGFPLPASFRGKRRRVGKTVPRRRTARTEFRRGCVATTSEQRRTKQTEEGNCDIG